MEKHTILITIITALGIAALNAWVNIKIKFAPNVDHATQAAKRIFLIVIFGLSQAYLAGSLILDLSDSSPLTKESLFRILISSFGLFSTFVFYWVYRILRVLEKMTEITEKIVRDVKSPAG